MVLLQLIEVDLLKVCFCSKHLFRFILKLKVVFSLVFIRNDSVELFLITLLEQKPVIQLLYLFCSFILDVRCDIVLSVFPNDLLD